VPSDADKAYERAMSANSWITDGYFDEEGQASAFIDAMYDDEDYFFEYGQQWSDDPSSFGYNYQE
jgi:hypothetical protein